ncbi:hypothetical protein BDV34DRAFT_231647 [Aspergillus parasiticus]|uniref:Uncharacterized protein n=1 Tax=Aspergillus parasiticus TaxID=5067 RepID=A0A5N6D135_ASPPA|nr:hypothetical protein BDV34DRAFT_231647 [Aspergillus parasiticus]
MVVHLDRRDVEGATEVGNDTQVLIKPEKEEEESIEKKNGTSSFLQKVFTFSNPRLYILEYIAFVAAITSGVTITIINLVIGNFFTLLNDFSFSDATSIPGDFITAVRISA